MFGKFGDHGGEVVRAETREDRGPCVCLPVERCCLCGIGCINEVATEAKRKRKRDVEKDDFSSLPTLFKTCDKV